MSDRHIADAEGTFKVVNVSPDLCFVNGSVVPFEIYRELPTEKSNYASTVIARGEKVLHVDSIIQGVVGNAGSGVISGVSQGGGDNVILEGSTVLNVEGARCARHLDLVGMNAS